MKKIGIAALAAGLGLLLTTAPSFAWANGSFSKYDSSVTNSWTNGCNGCDVHLSGSYQYDLQLGVKDSGQGATCLSDGSNPSNVIITGEGYYYPLGSVDPLQYWCNYNYFAQNGTYCTGAGFRVNVYEDSSKNSFHVQPSSCS